MLILASKSPRRKEILEGLGLEFRCESPEVDESHPSKVEPSLLVRELALRKAEAVRLQGASDLVISADTIVYHRGRILGKPKNEEDALVMLRLLSGDTHTVYTGYAVRSMYKTVCDFCATEVRFRALDDDEIIKYIKTYLLVILRYVICMEDILCYFRLISSPLKYYSLYLRLED